MGESKSTKQHRGKFVGGSAARREKKRKEKGKRGFKKILVMIREAAWPQWQRETGG